MNMKKKRLTSLAMAAVLSAASVTPAVANTVTNNPSGDEHTTIGIMEMGKSPVNVEFEVPLYVTMAAKSGDTEMTMPEGYDISNAAVPGADSYDIGVTSMKDVYKRQGKTIRIRLFLRLRTRGGTRSRQ